MQATWLDKHTFSITVDTQADILDAGEQRDPKSGQPYRVKYLPCTQCGELLKVKTTVVSLFCSDRCMADFEEAHPPQQGEIPGYSHAAGYHD